MQNIKRVLLIVILAIITPLKAQKPYTQAKYSYDSIKNIEYGIVSNFAGNPDTLVMDIYRPKNDSNCRRPIAMLIHGGAWIAGSKDDATLRYLADKLARRGWVVANIKYRLGTHKAKNYDMYALCNNSISQPCAYVCDSAEIYRANFRAVQDAKGAIRFMKNRFLQDSTDPEQVYLIGFSAGAFIALQAAFTDSSSAKSNLCDSIASAPTPSSNLNPYACLPNALNLLRPDLGPAEGTLHTGTFNSQVKGVASFYGAILDPGMFKNLTDTPSVYLYHQGSDVVVNYRRGILLGRISYECFSGNICQPYYFYPIAYGGESIRQFFADSNYVGQHFKADIISNYTFNGNCFSNGHSVDNLALRSNTMLDFFSDRLIREGNTGPDKCGNTTTQSLKLTPFKCYPNPVENILTIETYQPNLSYTITDITGKVYASGQLSLPVTQISTEHLAQGIYFLCLDGQTKNTLLVKL